MTATETTTQTTTETTMTNATKTLKKILARVKFGKQDGSVAAGDCPEGEITFDGECIGTYSVHSSDEGMGMSHEYRVYGYGAELFTNPATGADLADVELTVERKGTTIRQRGCFTDIRAGNESCATTKARLRRMVAEKIAELIAAEAVRVADLVNSAFSGMPEQEATDEAAALAIMGITKESTKVGEAMTKTDAENKAKRAAHAKAIQDGERKQAERHTAAAAGLSAACATYLAALDADGSDAAEHKALEDITETLGITITIALSEYAEEQRADVANALEDHLAQEAALGEGDAYPSDVYGPNASAIAHKRAEVASLKKDEAEKLAAYRATADKIRTAEAALFELRKEGR